MHPWSVLLFLASTPPAPSSSPTRPPAAVEKVRATGSPGSYAFSVTVRSPDVDCTRYANWWEVLSPEGELLYRRILAHSHKDEQPFARSGGPVPIAADRDVIVRVHVFPDGYSTAAMKGTVAKGFTATTLAPGFAAKVEAQSPQPDGCWY
jgi:hypothetical protein